MQPSPHQGGSLSAAIERVRRAVWRGVFAVTCLRVAAVILFAAACLALLLRAAFAWETGRAAWIFAALLAAPLVAAWVAARRRLSTAGAATWLDLQGAGDGAVVTSFETGDGIWRARTQSALAGATRLPSAHWRRPFALCALGIAFAAGALWVPVPRAVIGPSPLLQQAALERVEEKLATLEEEVALAPEVAEELRASLERLKESTALAQSESTLEAADRASERLAEEARAAAEAAERALDALSAAESTTASDPEAAQRSLEEALAKTRDAGLGKGLDEELGLSGLELPAGAKLDAAALAKLGGALEARLGDKLAKLARAGLLKDARLARAGTPGEMPEFEEHVCTEECRKNPGGT